MKRQTLIIVNGLPASGKSTLADTLSKKFSIPVFKKDDFKGLLSDSGGLVDYESSKIFGGVSFSILYFIAKRCLESKGSLIIEGNFSPSKENKSFIAWLKKRRMNVVEVLCFAKGEILIDRFAKRKRHPIHHTVQASFYEEKLSAGKIPPLRAGRCFELDTSDFSKIPYKRLLAFVSH